MTTPQPPTREQEKLAAALRANLRKRKAQTQGREKQTPAEQR